MPLKLDGEDMARYRAAYEKMVAAINEAQLPDAGKFSLAGAVFTQAVEHLKIVSEQKHAVVDAFADTCHQLIDAN